MKTKELLLPAGNMDALKEAVTNGADAVYVGGKKFGARAFAPNFTDEELESAVKYCHLYGVKIYVTVNTMIYDSELESALEYVSFLNKIHVDAVLVSDIGLMSLIHKHYTKLPIHVSTQAHTFSESQMEFFKSLGATRVVVDREMSIDEINALPDILEIEVFIHGALCVCYSGECLMSAMNYGRSGNRGSCAQMCRLPYKLYYNHELVTDEKEDFLLSTKELNTSSHMKELLNSHITSFKIEGRMKSPEYVGFITSFYRHLMDGNPLTDEDTKKLSVLFNRGFTDGYLFNEKNIMNFKTSNHQGIPIGKVLEATKKKIKIELSDTLTQEDAIRFQNHGRGMYANYIYDKRDNLIHEGHKGDIVYVDNKVELDGEDVVRKTVDKVLMDELKVLPKRFIPITMKVNVSKPTFTLELNDGEFTCTVSKDIVEDARTVGVTSEDIKKQMLKLGDTPFTCQNIDITIPEHLFIPVSLMNEVRRESTEKLIEKRETR